jgi:putative transposase
MVPRGLRRKRDRGHRHHAIAKRDAAVARRFFENAIRHNTAPDKVTMDKSGANHAAPEQLNKERKVPITIRQLKYLNNIVKQDHRAIKRITWPCSVSNRFKRRARSWPALN